MKSILIFAVLVAVTGSCFATENPPYEFVSEYIREISAIENIRELGERELKESGSDSNQRMATTIRHSTRVILELQAGIAMLNGIKLKPPSEETPKAIVGIYEQKIAMYQMMSDIASQFLSGPKPDVDYGKLAAQMPKITAMLEQIDNSQMKATPLIFAALIDMKADSQGKASHLVISKEERQALRNQLVRYFGAKLNMKIQNGVVSSASILKSYLENKTFKNAGDPW